MKINSLFSLLLCISLTSCSCFKNESIDSIKTSDNDQLIGSPQEIMQTADWTSFFEEISSYDSINHLDSYDEKLKTNMGNILLENNIDIINLNDNDEKTDDIIDIDDANEVTNSSLKLDEYNENELDELFDSKNIEEENTNVANKIISLLFSSSPSNEVSNDDIQSSSINKI